MKSINGHILFAYTGPLFYDEILFDDAFVDPDDDFKPMGGLWMSPYLGKIDISEWISFIRCNIPDRVERASHCTLFSIKDDANVLILDNDIAFAKMYPQYIKEKNSDRILEAMVMNNVKFDKIIQDGYDAFFLDGDISTRVSEVSIFERPVKMFGWDVETLYIINKNILNVVDTFMV